ncbi:hypothetical protein CQW23_06002 [Capsicum baccatum]|uniref:Leucine-rich repeat-containing N-terminal plant-type domain-containing protein n=1 Tax=Capsicum baccatum TaxID=33114 RepID=A0A2G2X261_CAPBA|nr:hypothetical protein CQW23_06002 [Capsicum baccatum]
MIKLDGEDTGEIKYMEPSMTPSYSSYEVSVSLVIKGQDIELEKITTIMTTIDLSSNHFEGVIPKTLKDPGSLWLLNFSCNYLKGDIPMELGQLNMLEALDLSWNRLTGKIPQQLTRLTFLAKLNLSQSSCWTHSSRTSVPSHVPQPLDSEEDEDESYFFSGFTWESVVIGYGFGLIIGTIGWSLMFKAGKTSVPKTMSWNESTDCCTWDGVTGDMLTGHVIGLNLSCSLLHGTIHPNSSLVQEFEASQPFRLFLSWKHPIRNFITFKFGFTYLSSSSFGLQLDKNTFETLLQNFTKLEVLSLYSVNVSSPIPMNLSSSLRYVDLESTNLQGILTNSFFDLPNLEMLNLGYNEISGELPDSIGTLKSLNYLYLFQCAFSGSIPDSIGNLTQIRQLDFSKNNFTSHIPSTISKLTMLTRLDLSSNSLEGEMPDVFINLQELVELDLSNNSFIGPLPSLILSLTRLQRLDLPSNSLSGPLPSNTSMLQKLTFVDLSYNSLNGTIPSWVFRLPLLSWLSLDHNQLSGLVDELKANTTLEYLDLRHNQFSGPVLRSLGNLVNLVTLDLSSNNISSDVGIYYFS